VKLQLLTTGQNIAVFTTQQDSTVGALSVLLNTSPSDLIILNASIARGPRVPAGTDVRYYRAKAA
jgi:hypothetical protein